MAVKVVSEGSRSARAHKDTRVKQKDALTQYIRRDFDHPRDTMGRKFSQGDRVIYRGGLGEMIRAEVTEVSTSTVRVRPYMIASVNFNGFTAVLRRWDRAMIISAK